MNIALLVFVAILFATFQYSVATAPPKPFTDKCIIGNDNRYPPPRNTIVPEYTVDLNLPPYERWQHMTGIFIVHSQLQRLHIIYSNL
jgi:hypothetical protein